MKDKTVVKLCLYIGHDLKFRRINLLRAGIATFPYSTDIRNGANGLIRMNS